MIPMTTFGTLQTCNGKYFFSEDLLTHTPCESGQILTQADPLLGHAIIMCLLGFFLIWGIGLFVRDSDVESFQICMFG